LAVDPRKVLPTKINLIRLRREERILRRIRGVIEEKRDVLLHYIRALADEFNKYQEEVFKKTEKVLLEYYKGLAEEGIDRVRGYFSSVPESFEVSVGTRVLFAVKAPTFKIVENSIPKPYIPSDASPNLLKAYLDARELLPSLLKLLELWVTIERLLDELKSTQRLINALDYVILPSYENAIKFIKSVLEERMREDFIRLKLLKRRLEAAEEATREAEIQRQATPMQ
jgi:V/A-type H+-transporting ATPase subunit D